MKAKNIIALGLASIIAIGGVAVVSALEKSETTEDETNYSYNTGKETAESRQSIYTELPENPTDEELEEFYSSNEMGEGSAYSDGEYDESLKSSYGYNKGKQENETRANEFTEEDGNENYSNEGYSYTKGEQSYAEWHKEFE